MSADDFAKRLANKYGHEAAKTGRFVPKNDVIPTGILSLDYALGTGGWSRGSLIEVFGPPDIGKSSIAGINAIKATQRLGAAAGIVAVEPGIDSAWLEKHGVDLDKLVITWPNDGEEAFNMAYDMIHEDGLDFVLFDSIGALLRPAESGDKAKAGAMGQSALITWGVKRLQMPCYKQNKCVMFLNQIRDDTALSHLPGQHFTSPGGHALKHACEIRVQLRPGKERYTIKEGTGDEKQEVEVGRRIVAVVKRTKKDEGSNKRAVFDFFSKETEEYPFGLDTGWDVYSTAKRTGVFRSGGAWLYHDSFPDGKLQGQDKVAKWLKDNPDMIDAIRSQVLEVMNNDD